MRIYAAFFFNTWYVSLAEILSMLFEFAWKFLDLE